MTMLTISRHELGQLLEGALRAQGLRLGEDVLNRILFFPVKDLTERIWSAPGALEIARNLAGSGVHGFVNTPNPLSDDRMAELQAMAATATPAEVGELGLVDGFFSGLVEAGPGGAAAAPPYYPSLLQSVICGGRRLQAGVLFWTAPTPLWARAEAIQQIPFYCPNQPVIPRAMGLGREDLVRYFNLDLSKAWGDVRPLAMNIMVLDQMANNYPWPPVVTISGEWWDFERSGINSLIREGVLTSDLARVWTTLSIIRDYNKFADYAQKVLKERARTEKTGMIVTAIGFAAVGAILGFGIVAALTAPAAASVAVTGSGAAVAPEIAVPAGAAATAASPVTAGGAVTTAIKYGTGLVTEAQKKEAVGSLNEASQQLQSADPAFANEVKWTAGYIDRTLRVASAQQQAARAQAPGGGSDLLTAAVGIGLPTALSVGISLLRR